MRLLPKYPDQTPGRVKLWLLLSAVVLVTTVVNAVAADFELSINDVNVPFEGSTGTTQAIFTVSVQGSAARTQPITVHYSTANDTATGGSQCSGAVDYATLTNGGVSIFPNQTENTIAITVCGDNLDEQDETFFVHLHTPSDGVSIADGEGKATIIDDDPQPRMSINNVTVTEGNTGTANANVPVSLSQASGNNVSVDYSTTNDSATGGTCGTAGVDYEGRSGTLNFPTGATNRTISIAVCGDTAVENDETFRVSLSNASNATIGNSSAFGTITNDDDPSLRITGVSAVGRFKEGNTGTKNMNFTVRLTAPISKPVTVDYTTIEGTANGHTSCAVTRRIRADYITTSGRLTIPAGSTRAIIGVPVCGDTTDEDNESFRVKLSNPSNAKFITITAGNSQKTLDSSTGLITNDD